MNKPAPHSRTRLVAFGFAMGILYGIAGMIIGAAIIAGVSFGALLSFVDESLGRLLGDFYPVILLLICGLWGSVWGWRRASRPYGQ
jgi:hypothetical protein